MRLKLSHFFLVRQVGQMILIPQKTSAVVKVSLSHITWRLMLCFLKTFSTYMEKSYIFKDNQLKEITKPTIALRDFPLSAFLTLWQLLHFTHF